MALSRRKKGGVSKTYTAERNQLSVEKERTKPSHQKVVSYAIEVEKEGWNNDDFRNYY